MPEHSLTVGRTVISAIERLGEVLGYVTGTEWPLEKSATPAAVDVVCFSDPEQQIPILMFEIESTPAASLSNNAMKVLGKESSVLQKPLFFFHIVVKGGRKSSRISLTEKVFNSHNYRIYLLGRAEALALLSDIFEQHRRLHSEFDLARTIAVIMADWPSVDLIALLKHIEDLRFSTPYLETYALLANRVPACKERFFEFLLNSERSHVRAGCEYSLTYLGSQWSRPIHIALLANQSVERGDEYLEKLSMWQDNSIFMSQIGPHWGLSRDYDEFLARLSPFLWALIAALFKASPKALTYVCDQIIEVLRSINRGPNKITFLHAVWLVHIANCCQYDRGFNFGRDWINERGGINASGLFAPPAAVFEDEQGDWTVDADLVQVQQRVEFAHLLKLRLGNSEGTSGPADIALQVLVCEVSERHAGSLVRCLAN